MAAVLLHKATFIHIICVLLVVMTICNADVSAYEKWPTKTTVQNTKHKRNTTPALLNCFMRLCNELILFKCVRYTTIFPNL